MKTGFIGLGLMGRPMAGHLAAGGHSLHLWARRPESLAPFRDSAATLHASVADVAREADIVFSMVADAPDVAAVAQGVAEGAAGRSDLIFVDMSTIAPDSARSIAAGLAEKGVTMIDAPVSGGEVGAINAALTIMAGGDQAAFDRVLPLFRLMGKNVTRVGDSGAGQVAKACNQILTGVGVLALAEAFAFAEKSGVDAARVREALLGGFAYSRILENHGQRMLDRNFKAGFKSWMHQKDLRIVMNEAHQMGLALPAAAAAAQMLNAMVGQGLGEEDSIAVLKVLEGLGGIDR
jgi:3-hydroxyisobutyrate dehydrogenase-like beta-hydroxyacid dehydrogenase